MRWIKKGQIFAPSGNHDWMVTHAAVPFAERIGEDRFRVYCCSRDEKNRARVGYFDINITHPKKILYLHDQPIVDLGPLGSFEDSGVVGSWIVNFNNKKYLYYAGLTLGITVPFYFYTNLAISEDNGQNYYKVCSSPILDRSQIDPYLTGQVCVLIESGTWRMWYVSGDRWELEHGQPKHYYHIKYAESTDGIKWNRNGIICIDFKGDEYAIARPCVIKEDNAYKMWYAYRSKNYRIGYAESRDGIHWDRKDDEVGIDVSESGWDSEMIVYPFVFDHKDQKYMLYNGNGYGKTGIGLAVLADNTRLIEA